jgi:choline-sulfatase
VHYVGHRPRLFDLRADPQEAHNLGTSPEHAADLEAEFRKMSVRDAVDARSFADQEPPSPSTAGPR